MFPSSNDGYEALNGTYLETILTAMVSTVCNGEIFCGSNVKRCVPSPLAICTCRKLDHRMGSWGNSNKKIAKIITTLATFCPLFAPCPLPIPLLSDCLWRNERDRHSWMFTFKAHTKASILLQHKTVAWQVMSPPFSSSLLGSLRSKTKLIEANEWSSMLSATHQPVLVSDLWFTGK